MRLVFATSNQGKLLEAQTIFIDTISIISLAQACAEIGVSPDVVSNTPECGDTFALNALEKAQAVAQLLELNVLADDSGLCVDALHGEPGVKSRRWHAGSDADRNTALLKRLNSLGSESDRSAQFVSSVCVFFYPDRTWIGAEGVVHGEIVQPRGENNFGYDPIFQPVGSTRTFAEMSLKEKNQFSHRGTAFKALQRLLA